MGNGRGRSQPNGGSNRALPRPNGKLSRTIIAVVAGYGANALLTTIMEQFLLKPLSAAAYFMADFVTQCLYEVIAGYLCCALAGLAVRKIAMFILIAAGWVVGLVSLGTSWNSEPHWYGIALLVVWAPCIWFGDRLRRRSEENRPAI